MGPRVEQEEEEEATEQAGESGREMVDCKMAFSGMDACWAIWERIRAW